MRRSPLLRKTELRAKALKPWRRADSDKVTPELHDYILERDGGCIGPRIGMERACFGRLEIDHLMNGGTGKRGPSIPSNLSALCGQHHYTKTVEARKWRPIIAAYIESVAVDGPWLP